MVPVTQLKSIQIIELKFVILIPGKNAPHREDVELRVPVQMGHESEADRVIGRLRARLSTTIQPSGTASQ